MMIDAMMHRQAAEEEEGRVMAATKQGTEIMDIYGDVEYRWQRS
jgi:hypothetical protein